MVDTIGLRLYVDGARTMDDIGGLLSGSLYACNHENGSEYVSGHLDGLSITARPHQVTVTRGSLCKWYRGNNYEPMTREDIGHALENLSDALRLPMYDAEITRLDWGACVTLDNPVSAYFPLLDYLDGFGRYTGPHSVYFNRHTSREFVEALFYDKHRDSEDKGGTIPPEYVGKNVLRYELQHKCGFRRFCRSLGRDDVRASTLTEAAFFGALNRHWADMYFKIFKQINTNININDMINTGILKNVATKSELEDVAVSMLVQVVGLDTAFQLLDSRTDLTKKQRHDLKKAIVKAVKVLPVLNARDADKAAELDDRIREAAAY